MKLRSCVWPIVALVAFLQSAPTSCSGGGSSPGTLTLSPTSLSFTLLNQQQEVTISESNYTGNFLYDPSNCAGIATVSGQPIGPSSQVNVTAQAPGTCILYVSDNQGNSQSLGVTVTNGGAATPTPGPGPLSITPSSLTFTGVGAPNQNVTITDPNNTGTITDAAGNKCVSGGNTIWTLNASPNGPASQRFVTPVAVGSCTDTYTDAYNNSATLAVTVGSATATPSPTPSATPTPPPGLAVSSISELSGGSVAGQGGTTAGAVKISHNSGDTNWNPDGALFIAWNSSLSGLAVPSAPYPVSPPAGYFAFEITGTPPPSDSFAPATEDTGVCYAKSFACAGGTSYGATYYDNATYYGVQGGVELGFAHKTPCESYTLSVYGPQTSTYTFQFEAPATGATPCPGSTTPPIVVPTPCVGGTWTQGTFATPTPCGTPNPATLPAGLPTPIPFRVLEHYTSYSLGDLLCTGSPSSPPETCTINPDSQAQIQMLGSIGMGAAKLEFPTSVLWQGCQEGQGGPRSGVSYTNPDLTCFTTITNALHAQGVEVVPHIIANENPGSYQMGGGNIPLARGEQFAHQCGQVASWASTNYTSVREFVMFNEPNTSPWGDFPLQAYLVSGVSAGATTITVQEQNGTTIPNSGGTTPFSPTAVNPNTGSSGTQVGFWDGSNWTSTEKATMASVTSLGNGEYTIALKSGLVYAHSANAPITLNSDISGYTAGMYALQCYAQIKAVNANYLVDGPEISGASNPTGQLTNIMLAGCHTGNCWDVLTGHGGNWICTCEPYGNSSNEMIGYMQALLNVLVTNRDPYANSVWYIDDEWGYGTSAQKGFTLDMRYQPWEIANGIDSLYSQAGRGAGIGYLSVCYQCEPASYGGGGNYCAPAAYSATVGSNFATNDEYKSADLVQHGSAASNPACISGDGTAFGQAHKPAWATMNSFLCSGFGGNPPSCSAGTIVGLVRGSRAQQLALVQIRRDEQRGFYNEAANLAAMLMDDRSAAPLPATWSV